MAKKERNTTWDRGQTCSFVIALKEDLRCHFPEKWMKSAHVDAFSLTLHLWWRSKSTTSEKSVQKMSSWAQHLSWEKWHLRYMSARTWMVHPLLRFSAGKMRPSCAKAGRDAKTTTPNEDVIPSSGLLVEGQLWHQALAKKERDIRRPARSQKKQLLLWEKWQITTYYVVNKQVRYNLYTNCILVQ